MIRVVDEPRFVTPVRVAAVSVVTFRLVKNPLATLVVDVPTVTEVPPLYVVIYALAIKLADVPTLVIPVKLVTLRFVKKPLPIRVVDVPKLTLVPPAIVLAISIKFT